MNLTPLKRVLFRLNSFSERLNFGRDIISDWASDLSMEWSDKSVIKILDVGCGAGHDLLSIKKVLPNIKIKLYGIDYQEKITPEAREKGIDIRILDIERNRLPFDNNVFDLVIANQIFEYTKEIFWILSECSRVLRTGGYFIVGVPNMAALHNRFLLLIGKQPTNMHVVGPHLRGFTLRESKEFLETASVFKVAKIGATNLFPLPQLLGRSLLRIFPGLGITIFFLRELQHSDDDILGTIAKRKFDTNYMLGT
jgi:SAM-dependent methyltransferase